jgi:hypothetical protein
VDDILALCATDESDFGMWWAGVRLAKVQSSLTLLLLFLLSSVPAPSHRQHGLALRDNYDATMRKLDELVKVLMALDDPFNAPC